MLSIILPSRNEPEIAAFIRSLEDRLPVTEIIISHDRHGRGKGWCIREGLAQAKGDQIAFLDGDGDIPARMLLRLLPFLDDYDVVCGSKRIGQSPLRRKVMTRLTRWWFKLLFGLKADSQTGIKLFRREVLEKCGWISDSFVFDAELLMNAQKKGFRIVEVPIECDIKKQVAFKTIWRVFWDSICLKFRS